MKPLLIMLLTMLTTIAVAQQTVNWIGGTPGRETAWNEARNWDNSRIPDGFSHVVIKRLNTGHDAQPVITGNAEAASVEVHPGAELTIAESGELLIDGEDMFSPGLVSYGGIIKNEGSISLSHSEESSFTALQKEVFGNVNIRVEGQPLIHKTLAEKNPHRSH